MRGPSSFFSCIRVLKTNKSMDLSIEKEKFDAIAAAIHSETSPVGIDAKKTHVIILEKLIQIEERLAAIEAKLAKE